MSLRDKHVAILVENNYQDLEVWCPLFRMQEADAKVTVIGAGADKYLSKLGYPIIPDLVADQADGPAYDALIIPGGYAPDLMRLSKAMVDLVKTMAEQGKVVAAICHGSWMLASADVIRGRHVTGAPSIRDDLINAGATFEDQEVVRDANLITSRKPADLPAFCREIVLALSDSDS